ncbi:hypothetical protein BSKO_07719 [Bryopsis sp. KO-2023]|nr:hypothetical protein BSKO_07719 [Bryopsis sp. KO-2023]
MAIFIHLLKGGFFYAKVTPRVSWIKTGTSCVEVDDKGGSDRGEDHMQRLLDSFQTGHLYSGHSYRVQAYGEIYSPLSPPSGSFLVVRFEDFWVHTKTTVNNRGVLFVFGVIFLVVALGITRVWDSQFLNYSQASGHAERKEGNIFDIDEKQETWC